MASRYRALLIGNSTYPADEHNLQTLKGPVKDIAALNRALVDRDTGLFADVDVTLLPEATSARAIRALGRFYGTADRDDVLLVYFSGHGKLDQSGRLHLCMQDTDSTDLLSTAVSSTRINEFADASRARNVVVVLDCCHAGAFRGGDLGDAVAGPGRYILTSCRGTQLANDATVENATSFFTQHLVDGLLDAALDQDGDGYVSFSDLYAYVDRRLREAGKQIPQRRVNGDGDLRLAKRPQASAEVATVANQPPALELSAAHLDLAEPSPAHIAEPRPTQSPGGAAGGSPPDPAVVDVVDDRGTGATAHTARQPRNVRRWVLLAVAGIVVVAGVVVAAVFLLRGSGSGGSSYAGGNSYTTNAPWRLRIEDRFEGRDSGCTVTLTEVRSGASIPLPNSLYGTTAFQIHQTGLFRWQSNDPACKVTPVAGSGTATLPFTVDQASDSDAFVAPTRVVVQVKDYRGSQKCPVTLVDPTDGQALDVATAKPGADTLVLDTGGRRTAYLGHGSCVVQVSAQR